MLYYSIDECTEKQLKQGEYIMSGQKRILIVEDSRINRALLVSLLSGAYRVLEAENGEAALRILHEHGSEIDLILLDLSMPVMDGYTFLSIVKADPELSPIPVIVTTQNNSESEELLALSHGAADFVPKPYKPQIILHRVASIIRLRESSALINHFKFDRLTGLYSREFFFRRVRETLDQNPGKHYDILCSNVENFKIVNDVLGTEAADELLIAIADEYRRAVRDHGVCGRLNADHFACLMPGLERYEDNMFLRFHDAVAKLPATSNTAIKWGIYHVEDPAISVEQMCDRALMATRRIKGKYGKHFVVYDDSMRNQLLHRQAIIDCMEEALEGGQFSVYFQPKYRIRDGHLSGAEALVRWRHPEWGMLSPANFIPIFEKNGFITRLDQYIWDQVCRTLKDWDRAGHPELPVSVNVSRADLYNEDILNILSDTVRRHGLDTARLHLEITESAYAENPEQIIRTVRQLRSMGFVIELDDFGSGYSSLNMLSQLPLDVLKLDMRFIQNSTGQPMSRGILRFIMELARWMHLRVVAEGVETREQQDQLMAVDCDYAQGYLYAKPMPRADFEALLREQPDQKKFGAMMPSAFPSGARRMLLVADPDENYRNFVSEALRGQFQIIQVSSSAQALDMIFSNESRLAIAILGRGLSDPDCLEALDAVRERPDGWALPILVAGPTDSLFEEEALRRGASDYMVLPQRPMALLLRVRQAMWIGATHDLDREPVAAQPIVAHTGAMSRQELIAALPSLERGDEPLALCRFELTGLDSPDFNGAEREQAIGLFASVAGEQVRKTDLLARWTDRGFLLILKNVKIPRDAQKKCRRICESFQRAPLCSGRMVGVQAGLTLFAADSPFEEAVRRAEDAAAQPRRNTRLPKLG